MIEHANEVLTPTMRVADDDDVAVALRDLAAGDEVNIGGVRTRISAAIPQGHKVAVRDISAGAEVRKYGWPIGVATHDIAAGEHVHTHNLATALDGTDTASTRHVTSRHPSRQPGSAPTQASFQGYRRTDGRVGVRNELWVIATVGCVARTCQRIATRGATKFAGMVDGVHAIVHPFGCSQLGDDLAHTRALLAALATHPNAGGVLLVGLGCESNQLKALIAAMPDHAPDRVKWFACQAVDDEVEAGLSALEELAEIARHDTRTSCPASKLVLGMKCGGSDGLSGLTANPLVGRITDRVTDEGGAAILTEIPEIFGAEHLLAARAADDDTRDAALELVARFKRYFTAHDQPVSENPSPGNIEGGITTLEEKSLGAVQKAGGAQLTDVLNYAERVRRPGLSLLEAPGNDAVSCTALAAAGATVLLFTTGRGTPLGFPVPTLKIASNSALARKKPHWIDFNAGVLIEGCAAADVADKLFDLVLDTASGKQTCNERADERDIAIWKSGVTL